MANTTSAKKATRKIARRTIINKSRRTQMRGAVRIVEEAIKSGDRDAALKAMARAEPELMQAAQYYSQEQCEPKGLAARASDRQADEINQPKKKFAKQPGSAGLFLFVFILHRGQHMKSLRIRTLGGPMSEGELKEFTVAATN